MEHKDLKWPLDRQDVIALLNHYDVHATQQRIEIASILFARPQHLSAEQVLQAVNLEQPAVSKATVYNTLGLFAEKGLVRQVIVDPSRVFYDSNISKHHHLYNTDTGELTDISADELEVSGTPQLPDNLVADGIDVIIRVRQA